MPVSVSVSELPPLPLPRVRLERFLRRRLLRLPLAPSSEETLSAKDKGTLIKDEKDHRNQVTAIPCDCVGPLIANLSIQEKPEKQNLDLELKEAQPSGHSFHSL